MSDITKFLRDDHARLKRSFRGYRREPQSLDAALIVCDNLWIHTTIEEELLYPVLRDEIDAKVAAAAEREHAEANAIMEKIDQLEPSDPGFRRLMDALEVAVQRHVQNEETVIFPMLRGYEGELEMGRQAFARRQELVDQLPPRVVPRMPGLANTGWGGGGTGGGKVANAGW